MCDVMGIVMFFLFKQKTAYEMRISDWSSDVCSSDLRLCSALKQRLEAPPPLLTESRSPAKTRRGSEKRVLVVRCGHCLRASVLTPHAEIGRASCRERVCQYV